MATPEKGCVIVKPKMLPIMNNAIKKAFFVSEVIVIDPETQAPVNISIYKEEESGGMFGVDTSFLESEDVDKIQSPFGGLVQLQE